MLFHFFFRGKEIDDDVVMMKWEHEGVFYFGGYKLYELIYLKRNILKILHFLLIY